MAPLYHPSRVGTQALFTSISSISTQREKNGLDTLQYAPATQPLSTHMVSCIHIGPGVSSIGSVEGEGGVGVDIMEGDGK